MIEPSESTSNGQRASRHMSERRQWAVHTYVHCIMWIRGERGTWSPSLWREREGTYGPGCTRWLCRRVRGRGPDEGRTATNSSIICCSREISPSRCKRFFFSSSSKNKLLANSKDYRESSIFERNSSLQIETPRFWAIAILASRNIFRFLGICLFTSRNFSFSKN